MSSGGSRARTWRRELPTTRLGRAPVLPSGVLLRVDRIAGVWGHHFGMAFPGGLSTVEVVWEASSASY